MQKSKIYFKEIRKQVTQCTQRINDENLPVNPIHKPSFKGIKKKDSSPILAKAQNKNRQSQQYHSPLKINRLHRVDSCKENLINGKSGNKDCNRFSNLLESMGYSSNNGSSKKAFGEKSFGSILQKIPKKQTKQQVSQEEKCRQIKKKHFNTTRDNNRNELTSLNKLKNKLISPLRVKDQNKNVKKTMIPDKTVTQFDHESMMSQHDLVNTSKAESIAFDMSPCL